MRRNTVLFSSTFVMSLSGNMLVFSLVYLLADRFGLKGGAIGLFLALGYGAYMAGCTLYNRMDAAVSPGKLLPASALVMGLAALLLWGTPRPVVAALAYALIQGTTGFFWPPLMGWFTRGLSARELNRDMGRFNQSWTTGGLLAPFTAGFLYHWSPLADFRLIQGALFLIALILTGGYLLVPGMGRKTGAPLPAATPATSATPAVSAPPTPSVLPGDPGTLPSPETENPAREEKTLSAPGERKIRRLRAASWTGVFCAYAFLGVAGNILPLEIRDGMGYSEQTAGALLFIRGLASLGGFTLLSRLTFWHFRPRWIAGVQGLLFLLPLCFLAIPSALLPYALLLGLFGLVFSGSYNNSLFHSSAGAASTGKMMAIHEGVLTAGVAAGSLGGGLVHQYGGFPGALLFLTLLEAAGGIMILLILGKMVYHPGKNKAVVG